MDGKLNTKLEKKPKTERIDCAKEKRRGYGYKSFANDIQISQKGFKEAPV